MSLDVGTLNSRSTSEPACRFGTLGTLNRGCFPGRALLPVIKDARVPMFSKVCAQSIDPVDS